MKKVLLALALTSAFSVSALAKNYVYDCQKIITTAEKKQMSRKEIKTNEMTKVSLFTDGTTLSLSDPSMKIAEAYEELLTGGLPMKHVTMGGYVKTTAGAILLCERQMSPQYNRKADRTGLSD